MPFNGRFVQRVYLSDTRCATGSLDLRRHPFERRQPAAGKKDLGTFAGEGLGNGTPNGTARSVSLSVTDDITSSAVWMCTTASNT